jgi:predicted alpha/beta superfamily hydrolase
MSPSLWWDNHALLNEIEADSAKLKEERIWLDIGTGESQGMVDPNRALAVVLNTVFSNGKAFEHLEVPGAKHEVDAFAARFDQVLEFLFGS